MRELNMSRNTTWSVAVGAAAGVAAAALWTVRARSRRSMMRDRDPELAGLEEAIVDVLLADEQTAHCAIEVAAVAPGVIELTGSVATPVELRRSVEVTQGVDGVRTVVNRLEVGLERSRMSERQRRYRSGDPALTEQRWYGVGVGTGRRRQGTSTDPDRRDDRVEMVTDEFEAERAERPAEFDAAPVERSTDPDYDRGDERTD